MSATLETTANETAARSAVHWLSFFTAAMQTGFGPFVSVWLIGQGWSLTEVGVALSVGTIAGLAFQVPGGLLVDSLRDKHAVAAGALAVLGVAAAIVALAPSIAAIWLAQIFHAAASTVIAPAIAALTLSLCGHDSFSQRLGGNARHASLGGAIAAASLGLAASHLGQQSPFLIAAALAVPAIAAVTAIRPGICPPVPGHMANIPPGEREASPWIVFADPRMHVFAVCVALFHLSNAALLPLALGGLSARGEVAGYLVPATIVIPQLIVALASPWAGAAARVLGRRKVLMAGFAALPLRGMLLAFDPRPETLAAIQMLDGVSATVLGLMPALIAADLTKHSGHLNLAIGSFGLAAGLGATVSTSLAGWTADRFGASPAFLGLAAIGALALALVWLAMPETRPIEETRGPAGK